MGKGPGAISGTPRIRLVTYLAWALFFHSPVFALAADGGSPFPISVPQEVEVEAARITVLEDGTVSAEGLVSLRAGDRLVTARRALFSLEDRRFSLDAPRIFLLGHGAISAARADIMPDGCVLLTALVFDLTLRLEAESGRCDAAGCRIETAWVSLCPDCFDEAELAVSATRVVIHPSKDVDLHEPTVYMGEKPLLSLPFMRIRPDGAPAFFPPMAGATPSAGFLFGVGGRVPLGRFRTAQGMVIARSKDGFQTETAVLTPHGRIDLAHLSRFPARRHSLAFQGEGKIDLARAQLGMDLDGTTSPSALDELYRDPQKRVLGARAGVATLRFPGSFHQLETSARFLQRLDGATGGPARAGALALVFSLPAQPIFESNVFVDARASLWRHFENRLPDEGGWNRTVATVETEAFLPFHLGLVRGAAELAGTGSTSFLDRSQATGRMLSSRLGLNLELPLVKRTSSASRRITPFARYDLYPLMWSSGASNPEPLLTPQPGRASVGTGLSWLPTHGTTSWDARLAVVLESEHLSALPRPGYAHVRLAATGSDLFNATTQIAFDLRANKTSLIGTHLSITLDEQTVLEIDAGYMNDGLGPHTHPDWTDRLPALGSFYPIRLELPRHAEISELLRFSLTRNWSAHFLIRNQVWPRFSFLIVGYGLTWRPRCGCVVLSLDALHRPDTATPDIMASLELDLD